jgi:hypothetical protein
MNGTEILYLLLVWMIVQAVRQQVPTPASLLRRRG